MSTFSETAEWVLFSDSGRLLCLPITVRLREWSHSFKKKKEKKSPISTALRTAIYFPLTLLMQLHKIEGREFIAGYVRIKYWVLSHQAPQTITELLRSSLLPTGEPLLSEEIRTKLAVCICVFCCFCCYSCSDLLFWPLSLITFCVAHRIICILLTSECVYIQGGFVMLWSPTQSN